MPTAEELEALFGITEQRIIEIDENACRGILPGKPGKTVTGPGRPCLCEEPVKPITFKEPESTVKAIDARAEQLGVRRSDYLRQLVANDLRRAGFLESASLPTS